MTDDYQRFAEAMNLSPQELMSIMNEMSQFLLVAVGSDGPPHSTIFLRHVPITISVANEWAAIEVGVEETKIRVLAPASIIEDAACQLADSASMLAQYLNPPGEDELN